MGQIVKKKKGRPRKADPAAERDLRRSYRRRTVKYVFGLDDYFDEDEVFVDDDDQRRREKKLDLLLKLQESTDRRASCFSSDEDGAGKPSKKRKIGQEMDEDANEEENYNDEDEEEVRETRRQLKAEDSPPGMPPVEAASELPLPDKKTLELILDKLQRKDIYGVYAEPVDPEELPDYFDVIDHPMDFATVRNNLRNGLYATFKLFEDDVFLICSNAMQYNAPDTIYHKQARTIQELAKRKFHKIRLNFECNDKENKPEQKARSGSLLKNQMKRPVIRAGQEPIGSDFSSGATLATPGNTQNVVGVGSEKAGGVDGFIDGSSFLNENNFDKVEDLLPDRALPSRFGRRSLFVQEENRRATYNISQDENRRATYNISLSQPVASSASIFSTFDVETKHLMPVGLYSDHSYARSLARFAATLGSVAWKVASKRIEQALPQGFKFGQGWVGEYEPLPTPVLILENCSVKEPPFFMKVQPTVEPRNFEKVPLISNFSKEIPGNIPSFEQKLLFLGPAGIRSPAPVFTAQPIRGSMSETKPPFFLSPGIRPSGSHNLGYVNQNLQSRDLFESDKKAQKKVESNSPQALSRTATDSVGNRQFPRSSEMEVSRAVEFSPKNINFSESGSLKRPDHSNGVAFGGLPNERVALNKADGTTVISSFSESSKPPSYNPRKQGQGLSDPVQMMRMLADHNQQKSSNQPSGNAQVLTSQLPLGSNGWNGNDPYNAAMAAARAWMSVGAGGLRPVTENANPNKNHMYGDPAYNPPSNIQSPVRGEFPPSVRPDKNSAPMHAFVPQWPIPMLVGNQIQFQNQRMMFPQLAPADLSRFQSWHNVCPQMHSKQKQESLPPDLNIGFQSSGSPGRPSSGVLVDSQQPDLALQL
ncbi:uncharacterized protein LOC121787357 [Salvia splendens]|uniref:uncharacterized protein LOC121787357 n=1 Tax=Salvia splendens TaxID=180675 RepID=UPI001104CF25|nr:uncharacterized protein LOC121787357 [Salvia splendens]